MNGNIQHFIDANQCGEPLALTTVWDFHNIHLNHLVTNKNSNIYKVLKRLDVQPHEYITLYVYSIGRSQHSESKVAVFLGSHGDIYSNRIWMGSVEEIDQ